MVDFHNKTFFSKTSALIIQSSTRNDPSTFFKFFRKKQNGSWERPSDGEGLTSKNNTTAPDVNLTRFTITESGLIV